MRLLLVLITIIVSVPSYADIANTDIVNINKEHLKKKYSTNEVAAAEVVIEAAVILISEKFKNREEIQKLYNEKMKKSSGAVELNVCDEACKEEVQKEILKKYTSTINITKQ